jgi:hypothetical protein
MERYDLRSCYLPDLSGLHLRIHQFQALLSQHLPKLAAHLEILNVEPIYVSKWFLSFFGVTCPLPMLLRIYDVLLSEGATETLMRVALSLMQRNEQKLLAFTEFEDAMQFLLSRSLWDTYAQHADDLVSDFVSLTCLVSQESLKSLETSFQQTQNVPSAPSLKSAAASLLGRFWAGSSHSPSKSANLSLTIPGSKFSLRKSSSGQSITSTLNSVGTSMSEKSETSTLATDMSDEQPQTKTEDAPTTSETQTSSSHANADRDLHHQIEELLTALNHLQHQHAELSRELQREREERAEDRSIGNELLSRLRDQTNMIRELAGADDPTEDELAANDLMDKAEQRLSSNQRFSIIQTKHQLRDAADEWRTKHDAEALRSQELMKQLDARETEHNAVKEQLRDARARVQSSHREKQLLERQLQDLRSQQPASPESPFDTYTPITPSAEFDLKMPPPPAKGGLREFKLGRNDPVRNSSLSAFSKRSSSLNAAALMATEAPVNHDAVLLELVNAKTAEAVARQELEETKGKLDALRKILTGPTTSPITRVPSGSAESPLGTSPLSGSASTTPRETTAKPVHAPSASTGGFFSGWGRRG